ncbi:TOBE domain-containing protein [Microvirga vignae]|uniref:TOBE domain-containing protein n=1 Tax=Microvirga vignae TaxID=1225564 RepID=UPI0006997460
MLDVRPELISIGSVRLRDGRLEGVAEEVNFLGPIIRIKVRTEQKVITVDTFNNASTQPLERGQPATVCFAREDVLLLPDDDAA